MSHRATKSGFAAEAQQKNLDKFDKNLAAEILQWIQTTTGESFNTSGDMDNFGAVLKNGILLCKLMNTLAPSPQLQKLINGKVPTLAFKCMEVINQAVMAMESYGVPKTELFQTVDLWEAGNLTAVLTCCSAVGRKAKSKGQGGIGPKESAKNERQFTEEQLRQGQSVIGLQMGTNKGASQAGMNMGNTRHIMD
ncbi:myophilin-like [Mytilus edulis]|uniref:Transgelin n=1 Tax=Mytilus edulis TaxID=6550 RepID=A0A8S3T4M4_MYTED|nr:TAGLN [Mytilus edulis]